MDTEENFWRVLYSTLLANCPVDTKNMLHNIKAEDIGTHYKITISAPKTSGDYAKAVNYGKGTSAKQLRNAGWVERSIEQTKQIIEAGENYGI